MPKKTEFTQIDDNSYIFEKPLKRFGPSHVRVNAPRKLADVFGEDEDAIIIVVKNKDKAALMKAIQSVPINN